MRRINVIAAALLCAGGFAAGAYWQSRPAAPPIGAANAAATTANAVFIIAFIAVSLKRS